MVDSVQLKAKFLYSLDMVESKVLSFDFLDSLSFKMKIVYI